MTPTPELTKDGYPKLCGSCGKKILVKEEAVFHFDHATMTASSKHVDCPEPEV